MYTSVPHACSIHYEVSCGLNPALLAVGLGVPSRFRDRGPRARRSKKKRVRFVSYLRARGDLEAHPNCFGITETSTFQALSRSGRQVNYKFTLPPPMCGGYFREIQRTAETEPHAARVRCGVRDQTNE